MNTAQPVADAIKSVDFGFLSTDDIEVLSVKRIQNPTTFDTLLHPIPGGLYDAALGPFGDNACSTCNLNTYSCPGHPGHIELPVPVYHVTFMDQCLRLLRGTCNYCHHLRMSRVEVNSFVCKLRLLRHGLLAEAREIKNLHLSFKSLLGKSAGGDGEDESMQSDGASDEEDEEDPAEIMQQRLDFVENSIKNAKIDAIHQSSNTEKTESIAEERRAVIRDFLASITKSKKCANCRGICPSYRRDQYVKIFERALAPKDYTTMVQLGYKLTNAMVALQYQKKTSRKRKRGDRDVDEGIVADLADEAETSEEDEDIVMGDDVGTSSAETPHLEASQNNTKIKSIEVKQRFVTTSEVHALLTLMFEKEQEILDLVYNTRPRSESSVPITADMFFIRRVLVPPNRYRPESKTDDGEIAEAPQNTLFKNILQQSIRINEIRKEIVSTTDGQTRQKDLNDLSNVWVRLQDHVNSLIDKERNPLQGAAAVRAPDGIKQKLEKKEGLFRKNMMGKRVNFAARSVISPDPNIETNEIGVPPVFAKKLTYPEPVTNHNFYELKEAVLNGVDKWPGAAAVENENGQVINLRTKSFDERQALANQLLAPSSTEVTGARNKKVHRHLNNGDIVLMNRQPTLHKPSIMAHRAKVLPGEKTIRMHYANCNTYNADFDGDEMNMHFPQNEIARAEALQIADTDHQYLVATSGKPLRGLIQDHISMGVWMTNKDTFFDREHYQQLLYSCLRPEDNHTTFDRIITVRPAIIRPRPLWTGKQVITTVMANIKPASHPGLTLTSSSQTKEGNWGGHDEEGTVHFTDGELVCGILDKAQIGASGGGMIHSVYEIYGPTIAGKLLSVLGRLLTKFLHMRAFTCGMDDLVLTKAGEAIRRKKIQGVDAIGLRVAAKYVTLEDKKPKADDAELRTRLEDVLRDESKQMGLDTVSNAGTGQLSSEITRECLPAGLSKAFPKNQMQAMTISGAKGTIVNANLISCNLGQQVLEGRRVPVMVSGKTLPCFEPFETHVRAGGYVTDRFLTGIRPQEYFFHCMAGREGLIDTAVKTSRSGYLQRCLIKGMEGLKVEYDESVRDADGAMVQFLYGEDGLDVTKQKHLTDFKFMAENFLSHFEQLNVREEFQRIATDDALEWSKTAMKAVKSTGRIDAMDPVTAHFSPARHVYSTSETFAQALKEYQRENPHKLLRDKKKGIEADVGKKNFETVLNLKYLKSTVEPGEAVGILAGQSVGEPSTQMTLNTFHLAGHSAKNVTLGIPRLREIVMTASRNISTPTMTLHLNPELDTGEGEQFAKAISRLSLAEIIDNVSISERRGRGMAYDRAKIYTVRIDFYPSEEYCSECAIQIQDVVRTLEQRFVPRLQKLIRAELKSKGDVSARRVEGKNDAVPEIGRPAGTIEQASSRRAEENEGGDDDEDEDEDDTGSSKQKAKRQGISYDAPDEDEERIAREVQRKASLEDAEMEDEGIGGSPREDMSSQAASDTDDSSEGETATIAPVKGHAAAKIREGRVMERCPDVTAFRFDDTSGSWAEVVLEYPATSAKLVILNLVEDACKDSVIQSILGISSATLTSELRRDPKTGVETTEAFVLTEGVNIPAMQTQQDILQPHRLYTNSVGDMLAHYGVEACRSAIVRELSGVFTSHSIAVDLRHLNLIADFMTRGGGYSPFNRLGMHRTCVSPLQKMSYETTVACLKDAVLDGDWDSLRGPSARLCVGRLSRMGTGCFDVLTDVSRKV
ncbi:MAG: hypothetical protein M1817_001946 [Caeruleum heppii]|nr:MAG: hypothetical protein M1817_001946 [Caeruleum heppii]